MSRVDYNEQGRLQSQNQGFKNKMNTDYDEQGRLQ